MTTYMLSRSAGLFKHFMACLSLVLTLVLLFGVFAPSAFAYKAMGVKEIAVYVAGKFVGALEDIGWTWVAVKGLQYAVANPVVVNLIALAGTIGGIFYFALTTPYDPLPTPYNQAGGYWDYNNQYWVYPSFAILPEKYISEVA